MQSWIYACQMTAKDRLTPKRRMKNTSRVRQAAERIKYREQTVRNMMSAGVFRRGLHYYKRRGRVLFLWSRIEQWLEEDAASSDNPGAADSVIEENGTRNDGNEPFYPVHRARSQKKRQTLL
jgi:hypothetical protein